MAMATRFFAIMTVGAAVLLPQARKVSVSYPSIVGNLIVDCELYYHRNYTMFMLTMWQIGFRRLYLILYAEDILLIAPSITMLETNTA